MCCPSNRNIPLTKYSPFNVIFVPGVYAPFKSDMRKSDHIFLIKNFVLKMKAEEYCFNTHAESNDTVYDIVDDVTGQLHAESRRHIPPYVNEICTGGQQTVHAKHDPQVNMFLDLCHIYVQRYRFN